MATTPSITQVDPSTILLSRELSARGVRPDGRDYVHLRRGAWMRAKVWATLSPMQRHAALVLATAAVDPHELRGAWSHASAAALWGLPRIGVWPRETETVAVSHARRTVHVRTHSGRALEPVMVAGQLVTPVPRTVIDLARESLFTGVAAGDHAVRHGMCSVEDLVEEARAVPRRGRWRSRALLAADLVDPLAMSPAESLSRVQFFLRGLPRPRLQGEFRDDQGLIGFTDFDWDGVVGEVDGRLKYVDDGSDAVFREKLREDRLRHLGLMVVRWTFEDALHGDPMVAKLARWGIRPMTSPDWFREGRRTAC